MAPRIGFQDRPRQSLLGILVPPSSRITHPFSISFSMHSFANDANSSGLPALFGNSIAPSRLCLTLSLKTAVIALSKRLGAMVTTLMPWWARSRASGRVADAIAPFDAAYDTWPGWPSNAAMEETRMKTPRPPSGGVGAFWVI